MNIVDFFKYSCYSFNNEKKSTFIFSELKKLFSHHCLKSVEFNKMMKAINFDIKSINKISDFPFIPVRLFKMYDLKSINESSVFKRMTSSGTTGQQVSKIYLDKEAASIQTTVLSKIVTHYVGQKRLPMIIIDSENILKDRKNFSARGAGILGFSTFGSKKIYALDNQMQLKVNELKEFIEENKSNKILIFGFTFIIYQYFYEELVNQKINLDLSNSILIHGGGWKKLDAKKVHNTIFKRKIFEVSGIRNIHDYYGMVEQTGTIYMECKYGYLHTSIFSDIIIRRSQDFSVANYGEKGIIQLLSILPKSYPGQSILTEDEGIIYGEDDCKCGKLGKYFKINGRLKNAEIRGCSDTFE